MIAAETFDIRLLVSGMEDRGWRLLGVSNPEAIHLTLDVMEVEYLNQFWTTSPTSSQTLGRERSTRRACFPTGV